MIDRAIYRKKEDYGIAFLHVVVCNLGIVLMEGTNAWRINICDPVLKKIRLAMNDNFLDTKLIFCILLLAYICGKFIYFDGPNFSVFKANLCRLLSVDYLGHRRGNWDYPDGHVILPQYAVAQGALSPLELPYDCNCHIAIA